RLEAAGPRPLPPPSVDQRLRPSDPSFYALRILRGRPRQRMVIGPFIDLPLFLPDDLVGRDLDALCIRELMQEIQGVLESLLQVLPECRIIVGIVAWPIAGGFGHGDPLEWNHFR